MSQIPLDLLLNVVGGFIVLILSRLGRGSVERPGTGQTGDDIVFFRPGLRVWRVLLLSSGFTLIAFGIDLIQPPPPLHGVLPINVRIPEYEDLKFEAESVLERARQESEDRIREAEREADDIMERAAEQDAALRANGQTDAAQLALRLAERRATATIEAAELYAQEVMRGAATTSRQLESRAADSYGSISGVMVTLFNALFEASGTFLKAVLMTLFLAFVASQSLSRSFGRAQLVATLILASSAACMNIVGFAIAAELLVPFVAAGVVVSGARRGKL